MVTAGNFWPEFMQNEAGNLVCSYLAERGGAALGAFAGGAVGSYFGPAGAIPGRRIGATFGAAGGSSLAALWCPDTPPGEGQFPLRPPSRTFGNCDGVGYGGAFEYEREDGVVDIAGTGAFWGPAGPIVIQENGQGGETIFITCRGFFGAPIRAYPTLFPVVDGGSGERYNRGEILSLGRLDGQPDNCPPPDGRPQIPGVPTDIPRLRDDPAARRPIDIDVDFGGEDINITGDLVLDGPNINPDGGLEICFIFDGIRFCIDPFGGVRVGPGARGGDDPAPGEDEPPEDDPRRILSGVLYTVTDVGQGQSFESIGIEKYFYPRFGAITFKRVDFEADEEGDGAGDGQDYQAQPVELRSEKGFAANPAPTIFNSWTFGPYQPGNEAEFDELWDLLDVPPTPEIVD